mmetsp:Transcript_61208/g.162696  ORF Transcript_61208/g.162696 Transcript_61208/m.162696 type:complete len:118 (+) Transcript_61208:227-580(+)|eukprot:CAMPEP_0194553206 /NCGR_PEP_ID=MMETSP0253-20130528/97116_1 /TAXON_ID=2966 /ORGANISM="Noctiluca scintillans" /LENGTH=117 /DNA_ID=CAMNT_0039400683 /DNA_START=164 /DNA_END=517 /DNA_ORIENTATION=-
MAATGGKDPTAQPQGNLRVHCSGFDVDVEVEVPARDGDLRLLLEETGVQTAPLVEIGGRPVVPSMMSPTEWQLEPPIAVQLRGDSAELGGAAVLERREDLGMSFAAALSRFFRPVRV